MLFWKNTYLADKVCNTNMFFFSVTKIEVCYFICQSLNSIRYKQKLYLRPQNGLTDQNENKLLSLHHENIQTGSMAAHY